jgi:very-short-patch-repair endonuclease
MGAQNDEHPGKPWLHGVAARWELLHAGVERRAIQHRLKSGRFLRLYDGVYAIGHADLTVYGRRRAIVLACGPRAVLSHRSAAGAWGLRPDGGSRWNVTVRQATAVQPNAPVKVFRHPTLRDEEVTTLDGIPTTTPSRTLLDLAAHIPTHHLRRAIERAEELELFDLPSLTQTIGAHPRQPGRRHLLTLLADMEDHGLTRTRSDVEAAFLQLCLDHGLPRPRVNHHHDGRERDFHFPTHNLIVEVDGWTYHRSRTAFHDDRARDRQALRRGERVARFTAAEIVSDPQAVAQELRALLDPRAIAPPVC